MRRVELVFQRVLKIIKENSEVPVFIARLLNDDDVFDQFYTYVTKKRVKTKVNAYVEKRVVSRQGGMIKRCTDPENYPDYYRKGIKVSNAFATEYIKWNHDVDYVHDEKGRCRLMFSMRAMFYDRHDGSPWVDRYMEIHRIDDNKSYTPDNIVLIPSWMHREIHAWMKTTGISDSKVYMIVRGYWDIIINGYNYEEEEVA